MTEPGPVVCLCPVGAPVTGQSRVSDEVVAHLRHAGHRVSVINRRKPFHSWLRYLGSWPQILSILLRPRRPVLAYLTCARTAPGFLRDALFIVACRLRRVPVVNHVHGADLPHLLSRPLIGPLALRLLNGLACNVVLSETMSAQCRKAGLRRIVVLRNFCDDGLFALERNAAVAPEPGRVLRVLYLSNVMESKGIFDLIEACSQLAADRRFELRIVGPVVETGYRQGRRTQARLNQCLSRHGFLAWSGPAYGAEKLAAYAAADVYCLVPRDGEGAPMALLEAMAAGLPIVTTRVGGIPELVAGGEAALIAEPGRPADIARCLREVMDSAELRERLSQQARRRARAEFGQARFHQGLSAVFASASQPEPQAGPGR